MEPAKAGSRALSWKDIAVQKADYLCSDLTIENEDDKHMYLRLNLAGWTLLRKDGPRLHEVHGEESRRSFAASLFTLFLKELEELVQRTSKTMIITCLTLAFTDASARAVPLRKELPRWMEKIDLSFTRTTARGPRFLASFPNLRVLYLDHCPTLKQEKDLFKKLLNGEKFAALEELSLVGVSNALSHDWLDEVQSHAPNLRCVYFTRAPGTKALGWTDAVLMQTMRAPVLLPCGHVMDKDAALRHKQCAFCRNRFASAVSVVSLNPLITKLERAAGAAWSASVVDAARHPLEERVMYHIRCGCFYNAASFRREGGVNGLAENALLTPAAIALAEGHVCHGCWAAFSKHSLRLVFTTGTADNSGDMQHFDDLSDVCGYTNIELPTVNSNHNGNQGYVPPWADEGGAGLFIS